MNAATEPIVNDRNAALRAIADAYFSGLRDGDVSIVPYAESVVFRSPLAPGGNNQPLSGRTAVLAFFDGIYAEIDDASVFDYYFSEASTSVVARAEITLKSGNTVRVADLFRVNAEGKVVEQENHFAPPPAAR